MTSAKDIRAHTFVNFSSTPGSHCDCKKPLKNCSSRCLYQLLTELAQKAIANKSKWRQDKTSNLRWRICKFAPPRSKIVCMSRCGIIKAIKIQRWLVIRVFRFIVHMNLWITIALIQSRKWLLLFTYKTWNPSWNQPCDWVTFTRDNINNHKTSQHKQILFIIQLRFNKRDTMSTINLSFPNYMENRQYWMSKQIKCNISRYLIEMKRRLRWMIYNRNQLIQVVQHFCNYFGDDWS